MAQLNTHPTDAPFIGHTPLNARIVAAGMAFLTAYLGWDLLPQTPFPAALFALVALVAMRSASISTSIFVDAENIVVKHYLLHKVRRTEVLPWSQVERIHIRHWRARGRRHTSCLFASAAPGALDDSEFGEREFKGLLEVARAHASQKNIPIEENGP